MMTQGRDGTVRAVMDRQRMEARPMCPVCDGPSTIIDDIATIHPRSDDRVAVRACRRCGHWWVDPMPSQDYLMELYAGHSPFVVPEGYAGSPPQGKDMKTLVERHLGCDPSRKPFTFLEIGVGSGELYRYMETLPGTCYGIEPGGWKYGGRNIVSDLEALPRDLRFDIIVIQDVLEHIADPVAMLSRAGALAAPGCRLVCGYPNKDALVARVFRGRWPMMRPLGHLHFFSRDSTRRMMERSGWGIVSMQSRRPGGKTWWEMIKADVRGGHPLKAPLKAVIHASRDQWLVRCQPLLNGRG